MPLFTGTGTSPRHVENKPIPTTGGNYKAKSWLVTVIPASFPQKKSTGRLTHPPKYLGSVSHMPIPIAKTTTTITALSTFLEGISGLTIVPAIVPVIATNIDGTSGDRFRNRDMG
ncbi:hypothetical protein AGMMS50249_2890 [candidate division SR1 bacterium]|nr:hypothetical protein AGMMS50249_2890 [candidate division SR1 bacterium]